MSISLISKNFHKHKGILLLNHLHDDFLRLILEKFNPGHDANLSLCLSSCRREEGVSTIVFNMAMAISQNMSKRILLVDANARRPSLSNWLSFPIGTTGLIDVLQGEALFKDVLKQDAEGLFSFVPAGKSVPHPIVLFDHLRFDQFLAQAREQFDLVIFDAPALQGGPETTVLARKLDGFVMVIEAEKTRWEVAAHNKQQLADAGVQVTGAILNKKKMFIPQLIYRLLLAD